MRIEDIGSAVSLRDNLENLDQAIKEVAEHPERLAHVVVNQSNYMSVDVRAWLLIDALRKQREETLAQLEKLGVELEDRSVGRGGAAT